jgi:hypothetical protein
LKKDNLEMKDLAADWYPNFLSSCLKIISDMFYKYFLDLCGFRNESWTQNVSKNFIGL